MMNVQPPLENRLYICIEPPFYHIHVYTTEQFGKYSLDYGKREAPMKIW